MLDVLNNLTVCHSCIHRQKPGVLCTRSGEPFAEEAEDGSCPEGFFRDQPLPLRRIIGGAMGIVKAATGTGGASEELVAARAKTCAACPQAVIVGETFQQCSICKCATWAKIRNAAESCPIGKWSAA